MRSYRFVACSVSTLIFCVMLSGCSGTTMMSSNAPGSTGTTAPTVVAVGEQVNGVAPNRKQEVQFSEAMDAGTINSQSFQVADASGKLAQGTVAYDAEFKTASFLPNPALKTGATYTVTIGTGVASAEGAHLLTAYSYTFTTRATSDTSPLAINSVSPAANATCVSASTPITVTFDETPDASTLTAANFTVSGPNGQIAVKLSTHISTTQVVLTPSAPLPSGTITVTVNNVADLAGVAMAGPYKWSFSTMCSGGGAGGGGPVSFAITTYSGNDLLWNYLLRFNPGTVMADLNGDGRDDFVTSGWCPEGANGTFTVRLSTGDGAYGPPTCYTIPTAPLVPTGFTAGNFFSDGHIDVAVTDEQGNLSVWKNAGNGALTLGSSMMQGGGRATDVNHDGKTDLVHVASDPSSANNLQIRVMFGNGDGTFTAGPTSTITNVSGVGVQGIGDFDGDGNVDLLAADANGEESEIVYGDGAGNFTSGPSFGGSLQGKTSAVLTQYAPFDVNGDGIADLIGAPFIFTFCGSGCYPPPPTSTNLLDVEFGHSGRTVSSQKIILQNCTASAAPPQVGDFDGDGVPDIIVAEGPCKGAGPNTLEFLKGNGDGTFQPEKLVYSTNYLIEDWHVMKASPSGKPGLAVFQMQLVNNTVTNPEELILVNTTS